ncbi:MAG TPA: hypothetical protein VI337_00515 [Nitrospirales bacterium]|nr:hypothetical protein [Nitrospirales bacterium]
MTDTDTRTPAQGRWFAAFMLAPALGVALLATPIARAGPAAGSLEVEIKKHSTGKEATIRQGEKEWYILIDVDQDRTMIIRTESIKGRETKNSPEIVERPMSHSEVDRIINDFVSGVKSTLTP